MIGLRGLKISEVIYIVLGSFNELIRSLYKDTNMYIPDFAKPVHRQFVEERKNMYYDLRDGLHLSNEALDKWASIAVKVADTN